jgi:hypothetical protein
LFYGLGETKLNYGLTFTSTPEPWVTVGYLTAGQTYYFKLVPFNDCAAGSSSNIFPVTLASATDTAPYLTRLDSDSATTTETSPTELADTPDIATVASDTFSDPTLSEPTPTPTPSLLGLFFATGEACSLANSFWWWLCWPWWGLILLVIISILVIFYLRGKDD